MTEHKKILKYKIQGGHKECSFCLTKNVTIVMEMRTGKAICGACIKLIGEQMSDKGIHASPVPAFLPINQEHTDGQQPTIA